MIQELIVPQRIGVESGFAQAARSFGIKLQEVPKVLSNHLDWCDKVFAFSYLEIGFSSTDTEIAKLRFDGINERKFNDPTFYYLTEINIGLSLSRYDFDENGFMQSAADFADKIDRYNIRKLIVMGEEEKNAPGIEAWGCRFFSAVLELSGMGG